jgi:hypothetical protein
VVAGVIYSVLLRLAPEADDVLAPGARAPGRAADMTVGDQVAQGS